MKKENNKKNDLIDLEKLEERMENIKEDALLNTLINSNKKRNKYMPERKKHFYTAQEFIKMKKQQFRNEKDKLIKMKDIGRKGKFYFIKEALTIMPQHNLNEKVFIIERLRKDKTEGIITHDKDWQKGEIEYRIGYYIVGKIGRAKGRWIWGQFSPLIPKADFNKLINKAKKEGTIL